MASTPPTVDAGDDVEPNALADSSRWYIYTKAYAIRYAATLGISYYNRVEPVAPVPTRTIYLDSTLSEWKGEGKIQVEVWSPPRIYTAPRPAIINFHGGGFILGAGVDDARFVGEAMTSIDAVCFTVNYRLAPGYPFPTPIEDCVDAVLQIASRASEFGIDPKRIILSGFSAGGNCTLATWVVLQDPGRWNYTFATEAPAIAGLVMFYPLLDWSVPRGAKRKSCARPDLTLSPALTDLIDISYVYPNIPHDERTDLRMSPALMPDEMLLKLPPVHQCLCEFDMLLKEGQDFTKRLQSHGLTVSERFVKEAQHAWDKPPPMEYKETAAEEYNAATQAIASWLGLDHDTDRESVSSMKTKTFRVPTPNSIKAKASEKLHLHSNSSQSSLRKS